MGRHERFRSELAAGFEAQKKKCQPGRRRAFECLDRRQDVSLVEYGHSHGELHRAIKGREEASSAASPEEKALASEPAPVAPRIPSSSSVAFFLTTEDQTSAGNCGPRRGTELFSGAEFNFPQRAERPAGLRLQRLGRDEEDERTFGFHGEMDEFLD